MGCIISKTTLLEVILIFLPVSSERRRRPNSIAAIMVIAFASPIPLKVINCSLESFPKAFRFSTLANMRLLKATALSVKFPEPIKMAISSALLKASLPLSFSFSRGLSSSAQFLIEGGLLFCMAFKLK
ncbi:hypothetical protein D3C86_1585740 [compost metagenome]